MIEGMTILGYRQVREKGVGWLHELLLEDGDTKLHLIDDTDTIVIKSNDPEFPLKRAQEIWSGRMMGTSTFGCDIDDSLHDRALYRRYVGLGFKTLYEGPGEEFSNREF